MAEEAVQEAFVQALRTWPARGGSPTTLAGWIILTARNKAIDWLRTGTHRSWQGGRGRGAAARSKTWEMTCGRFPTSAFG